jgi:stage II sporulation protein D
MKIALLLAASLVASAACAASPEMEVRVRLRHEASAVDISGFALRINRPAGFLSIAAPSTSTDLEKAQIMHKRRGLWVVKWDGQATEKIEADELWVKGQMLRLGVEPVPYDLEIVESEKGGVDVVARLSLESYLVGVLPAEMPASWPLEALKAQAVAARSYVLRSAFERRDKDFDVDSTIIDQVYKFLEDSERHPEWKEKIRRAVRETHGQVLVDDQHRIVKAVYSADCGCMTEDPKFVWGKMSAIESVKDPTCALRRPASWSLKFERAELRHRLIAGLALPESSLLKTLQISGRTPSGRARGLVAVMEVDGRARQITMTAQEFRRYLGFGKIRSTDFSLRWLGDEVEIHGTGAGHGVGMCQTGAHSLAEQGSRYREILKLYYPKAQLWTLRAPNRIPQGSGCSQNRKYQDATTKDWPKPI